MKELLALHIVNEYGQPYYQEEFIFWSGLPAIGMRYYYRDKAWRVLSIKGPGSDQDWYEIVASYEHPPKDLKEQQFMTRVR